jgi:hypothetical protein
MSDEDGYVPAQMKKKTRDKDDNDDDDDDDDDDLPLPDEGESIDDTLSTLDRIKKYVNSYVSSVWVSP